MLPPQSSSCSLHNDYAPLFQISTFLVYSSIPNKHIKKEKEKENIYWNLWMLNKFKVKLLNFAAGNSNKLPKKINWVWKERWVEPLDVFTLGPMAHTGYIYTHTSRNYFRSSQKEAFASKMRSKSFGLASARTAPEAGYSVGFRHRGRRRGRGLTVCFYCTIGDPNLSWDQTSWRNLEKEH